MAFSPGFVPSENGWKELYYFHVVFSPGFVLLTSIVLMAKISVMALIAILSLMTLIAVRAVMAIVKKLL